MSDTDSSQQLSPLSSVQQVIWLDQALHPELPLYNIGMAWHIRGQVRADVLQQAIHQVALANDALRLALREEQGIALQYFPASVAIPLPVVDFSGPDADAEARAYMEHAFRRSFDLSKDLLWDTRLVRTESECYWFNCFHHLATDGWGVTNMLHAVAAAYNRLLADPQAQTEAGPSYLEFVADDRAYLDSPRYERDRAFWCERYAHLPAPLFPQPDEGASGQLALSEQVRWNVPRAQFDRYNEFAAAKGHGITHLILAALGAYFARIQDAEEVVIGVTVHNRATARQKQTIGMFSSASPVGVRVDPAQPFGALLDEVAAELRRCYRHQRFPIAEINRHLKLAQNGRRQLFDITLSNLMFNTCGELGGAAARLIPMDNGYEHAPLAVVIRNHHPGEDVIIDFNYNTALFSHGEVQKMQTRIALLIEAAVADAQTPVAKLPLMYEQERRQLLVEFNATEAAWPRGELIHQLFEAQAAACPQAVALAWQDRTVRYGELNARANRLAHHLRQLGAAPDQRIAICLERGVAMIEAVLAVWKAGAAYVPLDPAYPPERLDYMLADAEPVALITQQSLRALVPTTLPTVLVDDADAALAACADTDPSPVGLQASDLAYVIYTSGSSGQPKGVMNHHRGLCNLAHALIRLFGVTPRSNVLQFVSFSFDVCVSEIVMALCSGARLQLAPAHELMPGEPLAQTLRQHAITHVSLPMAALAALPREAALGQLQALIVGGEALPPALAAHWGSRYRLFNAYGPTEATVCATAYLCAAGPAATPASAPGAIADSTIARAAEVPAIAAASGATPIGRPLANTRIHILDRQLQPVPIGVAGELYIGGEGVARGYLKRPELSAERFIADPFNGQPQARLYKTGDLARWLPDGNIEFIGRNDFQVKIRGFRVEPGEIEARLAACAGVREVVVVARAVADGDRRLVAYVAAQPDVRLEPAALRAALAHDLADYMIPSAFVLLDALPRTPNGKLDRHHLPAPGQAAVVARAYAAPQGETETTVAGIWQTLLKLERVGRDDHFFELGGHSLLAAQLTAHVRQQLGREVNLRTLFQQPTLAAFAAVVGAAPASVHHRVTAADDSRPLPLSFAQQGLWFLDQLDHAAGAAYHMPAALRLQGRLDRQALQAALDRIVARHASLRTRFGDADGETVQIIAAPDAGFALLTHDLSHLSGHERDYAVQRLADDEAIQRFDLTAGPLIRGQLLRLAQDEHVLLITQHHIISDGWSIGVLVREISVLYAAFSQGEADPLPPLAIQYADYAAWQRGWLQGDVLARQSAFWQEQLSGAPALLELPADRPRPAQQSYAGGAVTLRFDAELTAALKALGQRHGATLFMTLLAGWAALLSRLSGQDDVVIGTPVANRPRAELEGMIGYFVNTLALRVRLEDDPSVAQLLARVKAHTLGAYEHQELPFEQVVEAVQPVRSMSHSPLFQALINLDNAPGDRTLHLRDLDIEMLEPAHITTHFDLSLALSHKELDSGAVLEGYIEYASDLFDAATIQRLAVHLETLLRAMTADDSATVSRLALLTAGQQQQLLTAFNDTARDYPDYKLIHQLFEEQAEIRPYAVAMVYQGERLGYDEVNRHANRLAHQLRAMGVQPDDRVAICMERSSAMLIGWLGILKAGAAYVPLDPGYPADRLAFMIDDCAPAVILTESAQASLLPPGDVPLFVTDAPAGLQALAARPDTNIGADAIGLSAAHLAYVVYTSGSTGMPKGVMIEHRNVLQLVINEPCVDINPQSCMVYCANPAFDASTWEVWGALLNGAKLLIVTQDELLEPVAFGRLLAREGATILQLTAGLFHQYAEPLALAFSRLDYLLFGGDKANLTTVAQVFRDSRPRHLVHTYGPTETTTFTATFEVNETIARAHVLPIGRPIANTRLYILDRHHQPAPVGVAGELYIGGAGVARGYLNRDALTAERFVADRFSGVPGARLYKTGDLARWLPDGNVEFIGRNDFQVKIRGFRIELGEIETRLAACFGVKEALVLAHQDAGGDKRLIAYLTAQNGATLEAASLRTQLAQHLADFMLPSAFVLIEHFPLTPNGKVDRRALPVPEQAALAQRAYEAPQGAIETALAAIWQSMFKIERVGRHDHFFELGGHSLLAVQLMARLRQQLGRDVSLRTLFQQPVLSAFAAAVAGAGDAVQSAIVPVPRTEPLALSHAQQRLWFLDRLDSAAGAAYHMPAALRLRGRLDKTALKAALDRIVARHEILRTTFAETGGQTVQLIAAPDAGFSLNERDLSQLPGYERERALADIGAEEAARRFDLSAGPLARGQLLRLADDDHALLITQHHIISDGWSMSVLLRELSALYAAFSQGNPDPLPPLALQYADYAAWQRGWLQETAVRAQGVFWKRQLHGAPTLLELPTDRPRPARQSYAGGSVSLTLDASLTSGLKSLSQQHGTTLFMTLLAGWAALLARLSGQDDVVIGTPVANRQRTETESLIGFFVNTLALRVRLQDGVNVAQLLAQVKADTLAAYEHQDLPFEQVVEAVQPARSMGYSPLFQVALNLDSGIGEDGLQLPGLEAGTIAQAHATTRFDLSLMLKDEGDIITGEIEYASDLFDESTIQRYAMHLDTLLASMVANDAMAVSRLPILTAAQRRLVLLSFNDTARDYPQDKLIHQLFEHQAELRPDATAVVYEGVTLSYAELNRRANQLAHHLRGLGVRPDDRIAICMERSSEMVVGWLGILKAGAAYVPLESSSPADRLAAMLTDSAPVALLTQTSLSGRLPAAGVRTIVIDSAADAAAIAAQPQFNLDAAQIGLASHHLAYVIYTSGSTGVPKGVMVEHRNVVQLVINNSFADIGPDDCIVHCANPAFDASTWEVWCGLLNGAHVLVVPQAVLLDPEQFTSTLTEGGATATFMTIALFNQYAQAMEALLPSMRYVLFGGEKTDLSRIKQVARHAAPQHFVHCYGPTETTTFATTFDIPGIEDDAYTLPIGAPLANAQVYIVDSHMQPVPVGVAGEMYIGGAGVARGYLNRPELTAERFVADPFSRRPDARLYKTGDVARWLADGNIEFIGRNDFQVKIRGFRIEPGEIEARLMACDGVREALVLMREDQPGDKRLVAYLTAQPGAVLAGGDLRQQLSAHLADYMLPSAFVVLDVFPLNANGKIDRKALPAPDPSASVAQEYEAPASDTEQVLAAIWQELLGLERVGRHDNFFELGGHSLMAVQLLGRVRESCQVELSLTDLFANPVLSRLADAITTLQFARFMGEEMEQMKNELGNLSESELLAILNEETQK
ncbi:non-ribosomal peptide synthetase [Duganella callida]|uniref:Amino acid adenylation domain-containing protein n=1 Tax=Duganella callida TaxID=2561932 RepID=A0A4Y9T068_9BURK|nr:non-ribosomal peptide synthetase [Duganella callida]TFW31228.1 amino acid adenylation domain-containing protein [Duganella callida]